MKIIFFFFFYFLLKLYYYIALVLWVQNPDFPISSLFDFHDTPRALIKERNPSSFFLTRPPDPAGRFRQWLTFWNVLTSET